MVYQYLAEFSDQIGILNVLRYITFRSFISFFLAFVSCLWFGPRFIRFMVNKQIKQSIRELGPQSHQKKAGTPTMGGGMILVSLLLPCFFVVDLTNPLVWAVLTVTLGFGAIGYVDDSLKVFKKNSAGLSGKVRLLGEFVITACSVGWLMHAGVIEGTLHFPFFKDLVINLGPMYILFSCIVVVGCANAVNFTDGLDGLAIVPVMIASSTLLIFAYIMGHVEIASYLQVPFIQGIGELLPLGAALVAAGLGFLWYNTHPAQVFMGDVGSLSLGGFIGILAVLTKNEILLILLGGIFVVEALSVIIQVMSFKMTGKRVFRMAPIHHHFELKGMSETKIIVRFWIIAILLALLTLATLKLR